MSAPSCKLLTITPITPARPPALGSESVPYPAPGPKSAPPLEPKQPMMHYVFVYGALMQGNEWNTDMPHVPCMLPLQEFKVVGSHYVGIEYGRVSGVMEKWTTSRSGSLQICNLAPPVNARDEFLRQFPTLEPQCLAFEWTNRNGFWDKYMSSGQVMYGYGVATGDEDWGDDWYERNEHAQCQMIEHNMKDFGETPYQLFHGETVAEFPVAYAACPATLAQMLCRVHRAPATRPDRDVALARVRKHFPNAKLSEEPMLAYVQTSCFCCS